jgi:hypothetical protein
VHLKQARNPILKFNIYMKKLCFLIFVPGSLVCKAQVSSTMNVSNLSSSNILYSNDFESKTIDNAVWIKEAIDTTAGITTSKDVARKNGRSAKFSFSFRDWTNVDSLQPDGHRTELHPRRGTVPGRFDLDKDYWIGFSNYFPTSWQLDPTTTIIWQFHGYGNPDSLAGGSNQPPLYCSINANKDFVNIQVINANNTMFSIGKVPIVKGQWNDWVMHIKFSYQSGFDTVWVNGKMVAAYSGSNFYHVPGQITNFGPYFKIGIYKPSWGNLGITGQASNLTMYDDALIIGNSKSSYNQIYSYVGSGVVKTSNTAKATLTTDSAVITSSNKAIVYPNPAKNSITVSFSGGNVNNYLVELIDISGKVLEAKKLTTINDKNKLQLDISNYLQGLYFINIVDDKRRKQLVKFDKLSD